MLQTVVDLVIIAALGPQAFSTLKKLWMRLHHTEV